MGSMGHHPQIDNSLLVWGTPATPKTKGHSLEDHVPSPNAELVSGGSSERFRFSEEGFFLTPNETCDESCPDGDLTSEVPYGRFQSEAPRTLEDSSVPFTGSSNWGSFHSSLSCCFFFPIFHLRFPLCHGFPNRGSECQRKVVQTKAPQRQVPCGHNLQSSKCP